MRYQRLEPLRPQSSNRQWGAVDVPPTVPLQIRDMINNHNILPSPLSPSLSAGTVTGRIAPRDSHLRERRAYSERFTLDAEILACRGILRPFFRKTTCFEEFDYHQDRSSSMGVFLWPGNYPHAEHRRTVRLGHLNLSRRK